MNLPFPFLDFQGALSTLLSHVAPHIRSPPWHSGIFYRFFPLALRILKVVYNHGESFYAVIIDTLEYLTPFWVPPQDALWRPRVQPMIALSSAHPRKYWWQVTAASCVSLRISFCFREVFPPSSFFSVCRFAVFFLGGSDLPPNP